MHAPTHLDLSLDLLPLAFPPLQPCQEYQGQVLCAINKYQQQIKKLCKFQLSVNPATMHSKTATLQSVVNFLYP